jgi:hypothetical protein
LFSLSLNFKYLPSPSASILSYKKATRLAEDISCYSALSLLLVISIMSVLGTRSTSFSFGQPPAKQPFNFGGASSTAGSTATNANSTAQQPQASIIPTFSFGGATAAPPAATASTSLFGAANNAPKSVGFSFGAPNAAQQPQQQQQQQQTGGLFGGFGQQQTGQAQGGQTNLGGSLFGAKWVESVGWSNGIASDDLDAVPATRRIHSKGHLSLVLATTTTTQHNNPHSRLAALNPFLSDSRSNLSNHNNSHNSSRTLVKVYKELLNLDKFSHPSKSIPLHHLHDRPFIKKSDSTNYQRRVASYWKNWIPISTHN